MVVRERSNLVLRERIALTASVASKVHTIVIARLSKYMNLDELKYHVQSNVDGEVLSSFEVGVSQSCATKVTCRVCTHMSAKSVTLRLRSKA
jgi:flavorubredoxin